MENRTHKWVSRQLLRPDGTAAILFFEKDAGRIATVELVGPRQSSKANAAFMCEAIENHDSLAAEVEELHHAVNQDWRCDACEKWFSADIPAVGHECSLCESCAAEAAREDAKEADNA